VREKKTLKRIVFGNALSIIIVCIFWLPLYLGFETSPIANEWSNLNLYYNDFAFKATPCSVIWMLWACHNKQGNTSYTTCCQRTNASTYSMVLKASLSFLDLKECDLSECYFWVYFLLWYLFQIIFLVYFIFYLTIGLLGFMTSEIAYTFFFFPFLFIHLTGDCFTGLR
jgi:hypothetical protein